MAELWRHHWYQNIKLLLTKQNKTAYNSNVPLYFFISLIMHLNIKKQDKDKTGFCEDPKLKTQKVTDQFS